MEFINFSNLNPLMILFSFGIIGGIFSVIGSIGKALWGGSGGKTTTSTKAVDYKKQMDDMKESFKEQLSEQAQESKKTMLIIGLGAGALIFILVIFMVVGKK